MNEKELYRQKMNAQLDEWGADVDKLKARAAGASADARLKLDREHKELDIRIEECKTRLAALAGASDDAWDSLKDSTESAWASTKSAIEEAAAKLKVTCQ